MVAVAATRQGGPGSPTIVHELLRAGTDVHMRNDIGYTALLLDCSVPEPAV